MNDDDDSRSHFMVESSQQILVHRGVAKFVRTQFDVCALRARAASPIGRRLKPETGANQAKLDSVKIGDETRDQNRWLD